MDRDLAERSYDMAEAHELRSIEAHGLRSILSPCLRRFARSYLDPATRAFPIAQIIRCLLLVTETLLLVTEKEAGRC